MAGNVVMCISGCQKGACQAFREMRSTITVNMTARGETSRYVKNELFNLVSLA